MSKDVEVPKATARKVGHVLIESGRKPDQAPVTAPSTATPGLSLAALPSISKAR